MEGDINESDIIEYHGNQHNIPVTCENNLYGESLEIEGM